MDEQNIYMDMIPAYLSGKLNAENKQAFEKQLAQDPQLQEELDHMSCLRSGLIVYNETKAGGHLPSELIAKYATTPDLLSRGERQQIDQHLPNCAACQEDLRFCAPPDFVREDSADCAEPKTDSLFSRLLAPIWRPVLTAALILVVAVPVLYYGLQSPSEGYATVSFNIAPVSRDIRSLNQLAIADSVGTVDLLFLLPIPETSDLECELVDEQGGVIHEWVYTGTHNPIALSLPASYFDTGILRLKVRASDSESDDDWFVFRLQVSRD